MANVTIANIGGGEDTAPANTAKIEIEVGGVSKFAQLVNILKNAIPIGGTTPAAGAFTTLKQTTGKAAGAIPISDADGALTLTASTGSGAPVRTKDATIETPIIKIGSDADGDTYHRASGVLARLAKGGANLKYFMNAGNTAPEWASGIVKKSFTREMDAAPGNITYSGYGFKPSAIIVIGSLNGLTTEGLSMGMSTFSADGTTGMRALGKIYTDIFNIVYFDISGGNAYMESAVANADGFVGTWSGDNPGTGTITCNVLAFR